MPVKTIILLSFLSLSVLVNSGLAKEPSLKQTLEWLQVKTGKWYRETKNYEFKEWAILTQSWENEGDGKVIYKIYANKDRRIQYVFYLYDLNEKTVNVIPHNKNYFDVEVKTIEEKELINFTIKDISQDYPWVNTMCFRINSRENADRYANALKHAIILSKTMKSLRKQEEIF